MSHPELNRKFGSTPEWAKKGPISVANYDMRAELHGVLKQWTDRWPYLTSAEDGKDTADRNEWDLYFRDHLKGFPMSYRLFRDGVIEHWNAPDVSPVEFDPSYR